MAAYLAGGSGHQDALHGSRHSSRVDDTAQLQITVGNSRDEPSRSKGGIVRRLCARAGEMRAGELQQVSIRRLHLHGFVDSELGRTASAVTGGRHTKTTGSGFNIVSVRRPLPFDGDVLPGNQLIQGSVLLLSSVVPTLGVGDADQIILYAHNVGRSGGCAASAGRRGIL